MAGNHYALYGRADGAWAILRTPDDGTVIPPSSASCGTSVTQPR